MFRTKMSPIVTSIASAAILAVLGLSPIAPAAPASAAAPVGTGSNQEIRNQQNTLCLDDFDFRTQPGAEVRQWTCLEGTNQLWAITDLGNGYAEIKNKYSNLCLDDYNFATAPGSEVRQWTCLRNNVQQWQLTDVGGGWTEIRNRHNNLCLTSVASPLDGGLLSQQTCNGTGVQRWRLTDPNVSKVTWSLARSQNPTADELDAYARITDAMDRAVTRYNRFNNTQRHLTAAYSPWVETAQASISGYIEFGGDRFYMQEGYALHEISHTVGLGTSNRWTELCDTKDWPAALPLLRSWDGPNAQIECGTGIYGGDHMAPYGLNSDQDFNDTTFDRSIRLWQAMHHDGM